MIEPVVKYMLVCNRCAKSERIKVYPGTDKYEFEPFRIKGWTEFGGNVHYCPECEEKFKNETRAQNI